MEKVTQTRVSIFVAVFLFILFIVHVAACWQMCFSYVSYRLTYMFLCPLLHLFSSPSCSPSLSHFGFGCVRQGLILYIVQAGRPGTHYATGLASNWQPISCLCLCLPRTRIIGLAPILYFTRAPHLNLSGHALCLPLCLQSPLGHGAHFFLKKLLFSRILHPRLQVPLPPLLHPPPPTHTHISSPPRLTPPPFSWEKGRPPRDIN